MSIRGDIVSRGQVFDDESHLRNPRRWQWVDKTHDNRRRGEVIRKLKAPGMAYCVVCRKEINYSNRGVVALDDHVGM